MANAEVHPIDFEGLEKGEYLPVEKLKAALNVQPFTPIWQFGLMHLSAAIEKQRPDLTVKIENAGLRILTDSEASAYLTNRFRLHQGGLARSHFRLITVDIEALTTMEVVAHDREIEKQGKILQSIKTTYRQFLKETRAIEDKTKKEEASNDSRND